MAADTPRWGAERTRGELGKLGIRVARRTVQTYLHGIRTPRPRGQTWATFLRNHASAIWACDFLPVTDLTFRPLYAVFVIELASRRVMHVGVTRHPTDMWVAQQLREATPFDRRPRYLIRDNDGTFGACTGRLVHPDGFMRRTGTRGGGRPGPEPRARGRSVPLTTLIPRVGPGRAAPEPGAAARG